MALILNIDTSTEVAAIGLAQKGETLAEISNNDQKDHAAWIQVAIQDLLRDRGFAMKDLQAVCVTAGPGSYTGLRVGLSTAKGLCYALSIPLISINTLLVMAHAAREKWILQNDQLKKDISVQDKPVAESVLLCPMIDARRMEVFTALYDGSLKEIMPPKALILDTLSFKEELNNHFILFFGNGSSKWKHVCIDNQALYKEGVLPICQSLGKLGWARFSGQSFDDLAYMEPVYLKEFYTHTKN